MSPSSPILVTGASGFIGRHLVARLLSGGFAVRSVIRHADAPPRPGEECVAIGDIAQVTDFASSTSGCSAVIHLAGLAHKFNLGTANAAAFRKVNTDAALALAEAAAKSGVRRFVFVSTIGVHGAVPDGPVTENSPILATEPYSRAKRDAEIGLEKIAANTGMQLTIIRPPLVYGPNCPGNLRRLAGLIRHHIPAPFAAIKNRRSMIAVENLCDVLIRCVTQPEAANQTFVVADDRTVTTAETMNYLAAGMDMRALVFSFPFWALRLAGRLTGFDAEIVKLTASFDVDTSKVRTVLGWTPKIGVEQGLVETGRSFRTCDASHSATS